MFTDFTQGSTEPCPVQKYRLHYLLVFRTPVVDFMLSRIGPKWPTSLSNGAIGPVRDTIKSSVATTRFKMMKTLKLNLILDLETVPWTPL